MGIWKFEGGIRHRRTQTSTDQESVPVRVGPWQKQQLTLLRVAPVACPHMAGFNEPC